jgi:hypothetical protein
MCKLENIKGEKISKLYIAHCIDTEGPMHESLSDTFTRLEQIFGYKIEPTAANLLKIQKSESKAIRPENVKALASYFAVKNLSYLSNWEKIENQFDKLDEIRLTFLDDRGQNWKFTFFCLDHINYTGNPRGKVYGLGEIHNFYRKRIRNARFGDELQWHYHPKSISQNPIGLGTSFDNNLPEIHQILSNRILQYSFFPTCFRPGFHAEGQDANLFLEQWIPFDFANQRHSKSPVPMEEKLESFANWHEAPLTWNPYHPSLKNLQEAGELSRWVFRCLNIGSRHNNLNIDHVEEAFVEASEIGSAVLSITNHDYREMTSDIETVHHLIQRTKLKYPEVEVQYCSASEAARKSLRIEKIAMPQIKISWSGNRLLVNLIKGKIFSVQPYLAIHTKSGNYLHDNFTVVDIGSWKYDFTTDFIQKSEIEKIAIAYIGENGKSYIKKVLI